MTHWQNLKLGEIVSIKTGKIDANKAVENGKYPFFTCAREISRIDDAPYEGKVVLIAGNGDLNVKYHEGKFNAYQRTYFLTSLDETSALPKFIYFFMEHYLQILRTQSIGTTVKYIKMENLSDAIIPLPPIDEQHKIVELLEDHLSRLEVGLADLKQVKIKAAQFRRSLLQAAFTGNISSSGSRIISELPNGWEIKRLDAIAEIVMGQSPPGSSYNEVGQGKPFFQGKTEFGEIHPTVRKYTTAGTKFARPGDILMSVRAPVGPTNLADIDCVIGRGLAAIRAKSIVTPSYLRWVLKHLEVDIQSKGTGTTFDAITGETLRSTLVSVPPIDEQRKIVELLEDHLSRLDMSVAMADAMEKQSNGLRRSLLQAAFTGQLTKEVASV